MSIDSTPTMPGHMWRGPAYPTPPRVNPWGPAAPPPGPSPMAAAPQPPAPRPWAPPPPPPPPAPPIPAYPRVAPGGRSPRTWALLGAAVLMVLVVALVGLISVIARSGNSGTAATHGTSTPHTPIAPSTAIPPPAQPVSAEALPTLLLDAGAINKIMGARDLLVNPALTTTRLYIDTTDKPECGGVWANANKGVYAGSGWVAVQTQYLREPTDIRHEVFQSVVSFPSAAAAADFVAGEAKNWPVCNGRSITTTTPNNAPQTWFVATVSQQDGMLTAFSTREGAHGWACQHALTSRNNVVVDVEACGFAVMQEGSALAQQVAAGIH